jgi:hypothetical protein
MSPKGRETYAAPLYVYTELEEYCRLLATGKVTVTAGDYL